MPETTKNAIRLLTAVAAVVAALTGLWNARQLSQLEGLARSNQTAINAHVNAAGLHGR